MLIDPDWQERIAPLLPNPNIRLGGVRIVADLGRETFPCRFGAFSSQQLFDHNLTTSSDRSVITKIDHFACVLMICLHWILNPCSLWLLEG